jgi:hypothetical protein
LGNKLGNTPSVDGAAILVVEPSMTRPFMRTLKRIVAV